MRFGFVGPVFALSTLSCSALLGIDGDYDDATGDASSSTGGASGGAGGSGATSGLGGTAQGGGGTSSGGGGSPAGGGTTSGGGGANPGGGGTPAGGGSSGGEDCTNGVDDDGDTHIDCADPDCLGSGYSCAAAAPSGFQGPYAFGQGKSLGVCPGAFPTEKLSGGDSVASAPAQCGGITCSCAPATGVSCTGVTVDYYGDSACTGAPKWTKTPTAGCYSGNFVHCSTGCYYPSSAFVDWGIPSGTSSCQASSSGAPVKPPVTWNTAARLCAASKAGAGCGAGACLEQGLAPYDRVCVYKAGDVPCPAPYLVKTTFRNGFTDNRGCTSCSCGSPSLKCAGNVTDYYGSPCGTGGTALSSSCTPVQVSGTVNSETRYLQVTNYGASGTCAPGSVTATGNVSLGPTTTVCCLQ